MKDIEQCYPTWRARSRGEQFDLRGAIQEWVISGENFSSESVWAWVCVQLNTYFVLNHISLNFLNNFFLLWSDFWLKTFRYSLKIIYSDYLWFFEFFRFSFIKIMEGEIFSFASGQHPGMVFGWQNWILGRICQPEGKSGNCY